MEPLSINAKDYNQPTPITMPGDDQAVMPDTAKSRATRAAYGLSAITGRTQSEIQDKIETGKEPDFRSEAAFHIDAFNQKQRTDAIAETIRSGRMPPPELLQNPQPTDPSTVFERSFANAVTASTFAGDTNSTWQKYSSMFDAKKEMPEEVDKLHAWTKETIAKDAYIKQKVEENEDLRKRQSWLGWGWDQAKQMVPVYNEYRLRQGAEGVSKLAGGLLGNNLKEQADALLAEPTLDGFKAKLEPILENLKDDPTLQAHFLQYITQAEGPGWDNFWSGTMVAGAAGSSLRALKLAKQVVQQSKDLADLAKDIGKFHEITPEEAAWENEGGAVRKERPPNEQQAVAEGNLEEAVIKTETNQLSVDTGTLKNNPTMRAVEALASAFRRLQQPDSGLHGQELLNRVNEMMFSKYARLMGLLRTQRRVDRIPDISQNEAAVREVMQATKRMYPELSAHVMDVRGFLRDLSSNNWYAQMVLGRNDATLFQSVAEAESWASLNNVSLNRPGLERLSETKTPRGVGRFIPRFGKRYPKTEWGGAYIEQQGAGFYIVKDIPIDETKPIIRQFYGSTKNSEAPWGPIKAFTSWIRTPEDTMSRDMRAAALIATEGPSKFYELAKNSTENMRKLSKTEADDLGRMLKNGQDKFNEQLQKPGYFFKSIGEYDDAFRREIGRDPGDHEVAAYFEFVSNMEMDYWLREASIIRNQARWGGQEWQSAVKMKDGTIQYSPWFNGRRVTDKFPRTRDASVALINSTENRAGFTVVKRATDFSDVDKIDEDIKSGKAKLIQIWDTDLHQLKGFGDITEENQPHYVLSYNTKDRPLSWGKQLGRTEGGHLEREYRGYISQARVSKFFDAWRYHGDTNLFGVHNEAEGRKLAKIADEIRAFKLNNDEAGARDHFNKNGFPAGFKELWEAFEPSKTPQGETIPARLSTREPIQFRPKDKMIMDMGKSALEDRYALDGGIIDGTRQGNPARSNAIQYSGERDAYDFWGARDIGTKYNPLFALNKDEYIDAIPMMNRGLGRIINSLFMDDYKHSAVNHWLFGANVPSEADPTKLVGASEWMSKDAQQIAQSPFYFFHKPDYKPNIPLDIKSAMEAERMKIKAFLGVPSKFDAFLDRTEQIISNSIYGKFGPKALKLEPFWKLSMLSNGPSFLRKVIFNAKMGFFSPRQFFIHAFTFINGMLISPRYAGAGAYGAMLHGWSWLNKHPDILAHLDEKASKFRFPGQSGWKPGEWKEAHDEMLASGFNHVDLNQLALQDNPTNTKIVSNKGQAFLDAGMSPFRWGVKSLKTASWYTAFKEFRDTKPVGALTEADRDSILLRANDLSHNMSRASTSAVQKGLMAYGAMFSSYNLRLAEMLLGKRLSGAERARLFFGYMGIFGVPTAGGLLGLSSFLRNETNKGNVPGLEDYVPGYNFASTAIMEGLLPAVLNGLTGHVYDFGASYGAKDLDIVDSALNGDRSIWEVFGGAPYSTLANTWANSSGFRHAMMSMLRQDGEYTLTADDVVDMFKEISSVNYAWRTYMGAETGKWMSRNGAYLLPTSPQNAIFTGISGLSDQSVPDVYEKSLTIKERRAAEAETFREYSKVMQRWFQAMSDNNPSQAEKFGKQAAWLLNAIPTTEKARAMAQAARDNQSLVDRINWSFSFDRSVPDADKQNKANMFNKIQEMKSRNQ